MQHSAAVCQLDPAQSGSIELSATPAGDTYADNPTALPPVHEVLTLQFEKVTGRAQEVLHTRSRRAERRAWLRAVNWLIDTGLHPKHLHPKAKTTALRVVGDLARRMDYRRGIVLYDLEGTARRLKMSVSNVKRHVAYLRELGALVWLEHGSKRNLRLPGRRYTGTATIYGAAIPPAYDAAKGHRLRGEGYEATVIGVTEAGREQAVAAVRKSTGNRLAPPSRGGSGNVSAADVSGKREATRGARARKSKQPRTSILGRRVTAAVYQAADRLARRLRPLHNWTQRSKISELSWVLVDKVAEGCTEQQINCWLREISPAVTVNFDWRPERPHTYIAGQLRRDDQFRQWDARHQADQAHGARPNADFGDALELTRAQRAGEELSVFDGLGDMDLETRRRLVTDAWTAYKHGGDPSLVLAAHDTLGPVVATQLYGAELVQMCLALAANSDNTRIRLH
ncbi:hypothetical protein [Streptomyces javensis]|uniref:Uncharacterized protein n=1 Tax=Streptomyces javensis TaxID=114698 RepID=A0ABS0R2Q5_9ACTN|nr:hypothetical protein [Streptomyces javensis]MBI0311652.1 hypothetical protein [Streptomyces javensis]